MGKRHTPGPWVAIEPVALDYRAPLIYGAKRESLVAVAEGGGPRRAVTAAEARANAFLIAAAPELYGALEQVLREYAADGPGGFMLSGETIERARRALANCSVSEG